MGLFGLTRKSKQPVIINEYYTYNTPTYNTSAVRYLSAPHPQPLTSVTDRHSYRLSPRTA
jgi:hypothetical protein